MGTPFFYNRTEEQEIEETLKRLGFKKTIMFEFKEPKCFTTKISVAIITAFTVLTVLTIIN